VKHGVLIMAMSGSKKAQPLLGDRLMPLGQFLKALRSSDLDLNVV